MILAGRDNASEVGIEMILTAGETGIEMILAGRDNAEVGIEVILAVETDIEMILG